MARGKISWAPVIVGFVMIIAGLLLFANVLYLPLTIAVVDTQPPNIYSLYFYYAAPDSYQVLISTDSSSPTPLIAGKTGEWILIIYEDNINQVTVTINGVTYAPTLKQQVPAQPPLPAMGNEYHISGYTVPGSALTITVNANDKAGNTASKTFYASGAAKISGYWTINGIKITGTDQTIYLNSRTLQFAFIATEGANLVTSVFVMVLDSSGKTVASLYLTKADGTWTGSCTVPSDGTYTISGDARNGGQKIPLSLIITVGWGGWFQMLTTSQLVGLALMVIGAVLVIVGARRKR